MQFPNAPGSWGNPFVYPFPVGSGQVIRGSKPLVALKPRRGRRPPSSLPPVTLPFPYPFPFNGQLHPERTSADKIWRLMALNPIMSSIHLQWHRLVRRLHCSDPLHWPGTHLVPWPLLLPCQHFLVLRLQVMLPAHWPGLHRAPLDFVPLVVRRPPVLCLCTCGCSRCNRFDSISCSARLDFHFRVCIFLSASSFCSFLWHSANALLIVCTWSSASVVFLAAAVSWVWHSVNSCSFCFCVCFPGYKTRLNIGFFWLSVNLTLPSAILLSAWAILNTDSALSLPNFISMTTSNECPCFQFWRWNWFASVPFIALTSSSRTSFSNSDLSVSFGISPSKLTCIRASTLHSFEYALLKSSWSHLDITVVA